MIGHQLVVVADAHLGAGSPADEAAFLDWLDLVPSLGDSLLLAGDIYDFWFTYRRLIPRRSVRVTARLVELARRMPVLMVGGNHDRWGDTFWGPETGITFGRRELRFRVGPRTVLAIHGDGLHESRASSHTLNRLLDTPAVIRLFDLLPPAMGFRIAHRLGHNAAFAAAHPEVADLAAERQRAWAERTVLQDPGLGALVMGHTHRDAILEVEPDRWYVNPGAWLTERRFATIGDSGVELRTFR